MKRPVVFISMLIGVLLSGCMTAGPDYRRPAIETSNVWPGENASASIPAQWWRGYNDPELDAMIEEALVHNEDLKLAIALVAQRKAKETLEANQTRVNALKKALRLARMRYDSGVASLLDVLDVERGLLDAELNRIEAQRDQLAATADLYKALGGGWKSDLR